MDSRRTTTRQYSEYSDFLSTQREREYDRDTDLPQRESTQVRWGERDGRRKPDSGLGRTQDYRTRWTDDDWVDPDSFTQKMEQLAGHKRRTHTDSRWDIPRKRALFTSDGPDSTTSGSDIPESHADRPPEVEYSVRLISRRPQDEGGTEGLCSPNMELEMAVIRLQKDFDDCRTELELARKHTPAVALRPPRSNWEQYREVFEAIARSNGWDDVTSSLQLLSHLDGDALNVALLVPESRRVVPGFLIKSLSDHYNSPGRLAEYKRQFQRAFRRPGEDPSIFAIELETLARRAFIDIDTSIQLQMVRDRFIDGQVECALRRHLDSLGPDTTMADIVACCHAWESHREVEIEPRMSADRRPALAICQVTVDEQAPAASPGTEALEDIIRSCCQRRRYRLLRRSRYRQTGISSSSD